MKYLFLIGPFVYEFRTAVEPEISYLPIQSREKSVGAVDSTAATSTDTTRPTVLPSLHQVLARANHHLSLSREKEITVASNSSSGMEQLYLLS